MFGGIAIKNNCCIPITNLYATVNRRQISKHDICKTREYHCGKKQNKNINNKHWGSE